MKTLKNHKVATAALCVIALAAGFMANPCLTEAAPLLIMDNPTGGDCTLVGTWTAHTKTCTLTTNTSDPIEILGSGITLDGNGHAVVGIPGETGVAPGGGITVNGVTGVVVHNARVENFEMGVYLLNATGATVRHNVLLNNLYGILLDRSDANTVVGNVSDQLDSGIALSLSSGNDVMGNSLEGGCCFGVWVEDHSTGNTLTGNTILNMHLGMWIEGESNSNAIAGNFIEGSDRIGVDIGGYTLYNELTNNNFLGNVRQADGGHPGNTFAGNYWDVFDTPAEGCEDADLDGTCDAPFYGVGFADATSAVMPTVAAADVWTVPSTIGLKGNKAADLYIEVPGYAVEGTVPGSILLETAAGSVWANETPMEMGDFDADGVPDLKVKIDKLLLMGILAPGPNEVVVTGVLADRTFEGTCVVTEEGGALSILRTGKAVLK